MIKPGNETTDSCIKQLEQAFIYVTSRCNAKCIMCYVGDNYDKCGDVPLETIVERLHKYRCHGAHKATFLGGEATLHPKLGEMIEAAREIGYEYIRLTTNGMFEPSLLESRGFSNINTIAFSIDGYCEELNGKIRPYTNLSKIISNMKYAIKLGFDVRINSTVTSINVKYVSKMIALAKEIGASQINLNIVFFEGAALGKDDLGITSEQWLEVYTDIQNNEAYKGIEVKTPVGYGATDVIDEDTKKQLLDKVSKRVYCMQDGSEHSCLLLLNNEQCLDGKTMNCNRNKIPFCENLPKYGELKPFCLDYKIRY